MRTAGPVRNARPPSKRTWSSPPGKRIVASRRAEGGGDGDGARPGRRASPPPRAPRRAPRSRRPPCAARPARSCGAGSARAPRAAGRSRGSRPGRLRRPRVGCRRPPRPGPRRPPSRARRRRPPPCPARRASPSSMRARTSRGPTRTATSDAPGPLGQPARRDARAVAGHLRARAVGVPDRDLEPVVAAAEDLEDAVRVADLARARRRESATPQ